MHDRATTVWTQIFPDKDKPATPVENRSIDLVPLSCVFEINTLGICKDVTDEATVPKASAFSLSPNVATNWAKFGLEFSVANKKVTTPI
jgi:hypothetical protein